MPFRIPEAIKKFNFQLSADNLPLAKVILLGGIRYVEVCPGCSCIHQLPIRHEGDTFQPRCLWREWQRPDYRKWIERYPDAAKANTVKLLTAEEWAAIPALAIVEKPVRATKSKPTRRKKAA